MVRSRKSGKIEKIKRKKYELRPRTGMMSGLGDALTQGIGFGTGNAIAHKLFGTNKIEIEEKMEEKCMKEFDLLKICTENNTFDCKELLKNYEKCKINDL